MDETGLVVPTHGAQAGRNVPGKAGQYYRPWKINLFYTVKYLNYLCYPSVENIWKPPHIFIYFSVALSTARVKNWVLGLSWWCHKMKTFSALLALCAENSPVIGEFPSQRPVMRSFDVLFDICLNKRLSKQSWGWRFETASYPLWRHCNVMVLYRRVVHAYFAKLKSLLVTFSETFEAYQTEVDLLVVAL